VKWHCMFALRRRSFQHCSSLVLVRGYKVRQMESMSALARQAAA
jgi:hypothetical protein